MISNAHEGYFAWCTYVSLSGWTFVTVSSCRKQSRSTREEKSEPFRFFCPFRAISIGNVPRIIALLNTNKNKKTTSLTSQRSPSFIYQVPSNREIKSFSKFQVVVKRPQRLWNGKELHKNCWIKTSNSSILEYWVQGAKN